MATQESDDGMFERQEAITVDEALRMWTSWPAEAIVGGRVVFSRD